MMCRSMYGMPFPQRALVPESLTNSFCDTGTVSLPLLDPSYREAWLLSLCCACCIGCGSRGPTQVALNGTVTFDGQAIKQGKIVFEPIGSGKMSVGEIIDGSYEISAKTGADCGELPHTNYCDATDWERTSRRPFMPRS